MHNLIFLILNLPAYQIVPIFDEHPMQSAYSTIQDLVCQKPPSFIYSYCDEWCCRKLVRQMSRSHTSSYPGDISSIIGRPVYRPLYFDVSSIRWRLVLVPWAICFTCLCPIGYLMGLQLLKDLSIGHYYLMFCWWGENLFHRVFHIHGKVFQWSTIIVVLPNTNLSQISSCAFEYLSIFSDSRIRFSRFWCW